MKSCVSKSRDGGGVPRVSCCMCVALSRLVRAGCCLSARNTPIARPVCGVCRGILRVKRDRVQHLARRTNARPLARPKRERKNGRTVYIRATPTGTGPYDAAARGAAPGGDTRTREKTPASYNSWLKRGSKRLRITGSIDAGTYKAHVGQQCSRAHLRTRVYFIGATYRAGLRSQISVRRLAS